MEILVCTKYGLTDAWRIGWVDGETYTGPRDARPRCRTVLTGVKGYGMMKNPANETVFEREKLKLIICW